MILEYYEMFLLIHLKLLSSVFKLEDKCEPLFLNVLGLALFSISDIAYFLKASKLYDC